MESSIETMRTLMDEVLSLGARARGLASDTELLGHLPELDSMAVATLLTAIEDQFDIFIEDDEITAETFETFGTLVAFVDAKLAA